MKFGKRCTILTMLMAAACQLGASNSCAQFGSSWKQIANLPGVFVSDIYFADTMHGVVCVDVVVNMMKIAEIFYTTDQVTWLRAACPTVTQVNSIRSINGKLYAAVTGPDLLVSTDLGASWNFSGLGFVNAWDVYQDSAGMIRSLQGNYFGSFARVSPSDCMATQEGGTPILSNDGGITWHSSNFKGSGVCGFSDYGDTCSKVFMFLDWDGSIYRSTNSGATWTLVLQSSTPGDYDYPIFMEGGAGIIYAQSYGLPLLRTTDFGTNWKSIGGESGSYTQSNDVHIAIFGSMGEDVVTRDAGRLWITTSGGDGTMGSPVDLADSLGYLVDTLQLLSACSDMRIPIPFQTRFDSIEIRASIASDSLQEFSISGNKSVILHPRKSDTLWIDYFPHASSSISSMKLDLTASLHCSDWSESRTIIVKEGYPHAHVIAPDSFSDSDHIIDYGCGILPDSCNTLVVTQVISSMPNRLYLALSVPDTIPGGVEQAANLVFDPTDTSFTKVATVEIKGFFPGTNVLFDTILYIKLTADNPSSVAEATTPPAMTIGIIPNPAIGSIEIKGSSGPFTIFDPLGRSYEVHSTASTLDISSFPSGVYFISDGHSRTKFVKE